MDFASRQASLKSVLTCGICKKLCKKVTIIEECCHRFCKKCITRKITQEKSHNCPVCNLDLGCAPLQKIRPDNQVQEIRDIFSTKRREYIERGIIEDNSKKGQGKKVAEDDHTDNMLTDINPVPVTTSSRRKEKSISSIVDAKPEVSNHQNTSSGRRKGQSRNANNAPRLQDSSRLNNIDLNQTKGDPLGSSSTPLVSGKATQNKEQVETHYAVESSKNDISKNIKKSEPLDGMNDLWEPLNTLVVKGVNSGNKSNKSKSPEPNFTPVLSLDDDDEEDGDDEDDDEEYVPSSVKTAKESSKVSKPNVQKEEVNRSSNPAPPVPSTSGKGKKGRRGRKKKEATPPSGGISNNVPEVRSVAHEATSSNLNQRINPIWFTLVASDKQEGPSPLPQVPSRYLKIKDPNMPVSYIKKYLALKLSLQSEDEVEIRMLGIPILPALPLYRLVELWLRAAPNTEIRKAKVGGSAKDFVMVVTYGRSQKPQAAH